MPDHGQSWLAMARLALAEHGRQKKEKREGKKAWSVGLGLVNGKVWVTLGDYGLGIAGHWPLTGR